MDRALSLQGKLTQANCQEKQVPEPLPGVLCPKAQIRILTVGRSQPHLWAGPMRQCCIQSSKAKQGLDSTTMVVSVMPISSSIIHRHSLGRRSLSPFQSLSFYPLYYPLQGLETISDQFRQFLPITFVHPRPVAWPLPLASGSLSRCSCEGENSSCIHIKGLLRSSFRLSILRESREKTWTKDLKR